ITAPDVPGHCGYCDVWAQDCPERTKCNPYACVSADEEQEWDAAGCFPLDPSPAQPGEPCITEEYALSGRDDCETSSLCWDVDPDTLTGECAPLCMGSEANPVCEDGSRSCYFGDDGILTVCLPQCDPLAPSCADEETCVWNQRGALDFVCVPTQHVPAQAYGDDCSDEDFGCGDGLVCQSAGDVPGCDGTACCTMLGDATAPPVCPDITQTCSPFYTDAEAPEGLENICACRVPE
ncbi:MAG: hypothetical protein IAG13_08185, partial [Deltaproteobacteria bacterium]|nr:hypothetical protein [Nannocystaceae bacterium]